MKNNKKIILLIILTLTLIILGLALYFGKGIKKDVKTDAIKFKEEYESYNNTKTSNGKNYPKVTLNDTNPFVYADAKKIVKTLENGTGIIYLGFPTCPWCRNSVNVLQYISAEEILYLDITDQRDTYEVVNKEVKKTKDGSKEYYQMLELLDGILDEYVIKDDNDIYNVGEKRIYVPLVIGVKEGKIVGYHTDTVDLLEGQSPYDALSNDQKDSLKKIYDEINSKVYEDMCGIDNEHGC